MSTRTAVLALLLTPLLASAQDDPFETRVYDVENLTRTYADHPAPDLDMGDRTEEPSEHSFLTGEDLVALIRHNVSEDTWEHNSARIGFEDGTITVTNLKSVHEKISAYLAFWRGHFSKVVSVDALFLLTDAVTLAKARAGTPAARPGVLSAAQLRILRDAVKDGKAEIVKSARAVAIPGQRVGLAETTRQTYVRDVDVQVANGAAMLDPVVDSVAHGASLDVRPHVEPFENAVTLEVRGAVSEPEALSERKLAMRALTWETDEKKQAAAVREARLSHPKVHRASVRTTATVKDRETLLAGAIRHQGGKHLVFLVTPSIVALEEKPAPEPVFEEQRLLRIFDVSPLTRAVVDFPGPALDTGEAGAAGGAALTGASFALEEARGRRLTADSLVELIRTRIAPDTWGNKRNFIHQTAGDSLVVRQKPAVLKEIDAYLQSLYSARARSITIEAVLVGFRKGARADWEKDVPSLAAGGHFSDDDGVRKLLEAAAKGDPVRIADQAEFTCFPQQRASAFRILDQNYIADYEPQVSSGSGLHDPVTSSIRTGFVVDARPHFVGGSDRVSVDLRAGFASAELAEVLDPTTGAGHLHLPKVRALKWRLDVNCVRDRWTAAALDSQRTGGETEELVLLVRARPNGLK